MGCNSNLICDSSNTLVSIDNVANCCSYDALFLKEVILAYCAPPTDACGNPIVEEPEIPTEPEGPEEPEEPEIPEEPETPEEPEEPIDPEPDPDPEPEPGDGGDGNGDGTGGNDKPNIIHSFLLEGEPSNTSRSLESSMTKMENVAKNGWLELAMRNYLFNKYPGNYVDLTMTLTGNIYAEHGSGKDHFSVLIEEVKHQQLFKSDNRSPEVMYSPQRWNSAGGYYEVGKWLFIVRLEIRVTYTYLPTGEFRELTSRDLASKLITLIEKAVPE